MFLIGSVIGLAIHVPLLDRAERRRKEILTGGAQNDSAIVLEALRLGGIQ